MGLIAGIALKKVGMFLAVVVGVAFAALQVTGLIRWQGQALRTLPQLWYKSGVCCLALPTR